MPLGIHTTSGQGAYANPLLGPVNHVDHVKVDVSGLTTNEVDSDGYLKPGVPFTQAGILVASGKAYGITFEAVKVMTPAQAATNDTIAAVTLDPLVAVETHGLVNRDIGEDNLGRAYSAAEIAGMAAGDNLMLTST